MLKSSRKLLTILLSVVLVMPQLSIGGASAGHTRRCVRDDVRLNLSLNRARYRREEPVRMRLVVRNVSGSACTMVWGMPPLAVFNVFRGDKHIWNDSACFAFTTAVVEEHWPAGHREVYRATWRQWKNGPGPDEDQRDCERGGGRAKPGTFRARSYFRGAGGVRSEPERFEITRRLFEN